MDKGPETSPSQADLYESTGGVTERGNSVMGTD